MYFVASKMLWLIFSPSNFLFILAAFGWFSLLLGKMRLARRLLLPSLVILLLIGILPLGDRLTEQLERQFPIWQDDGRPVDGVVVLGGGVNVWSSAAWNALVLNGAGNRIVAMADLARRFPSAKVVFTGGYGSLFGQELSEANEIEQHLAELGIAPGRVVFERASRNTRENAVFTSAMIPRHPDERWLLVTSALHMPRAMGLFRKAGWTMEAYPVGWNSAPGFDESILSTEVSSHLRSFDVAVREWIGLIAARISGQSDAILPRP
jgi:uncharacterized SAM-binding protein YcdF (DUF218 family)